MTTFAIVFCLFLAMAVSVKMDFPVDHSVLAKRSLQDLLDTPEWLHDIPTESKVAKYRKRRFGNFPGTSSLNVNMVATLPTVGLGDSGAFHLESDLNFDLPNTTYTGRSLGPGEQRLNAYSRLEKFLNSLGYDGHSCTLRTICEVAEMPFEHGLFGEIINVVLT